MVNARNNFRLSAVCAAVATVLSVNTYAQEQEANAESTDEQLEVIEVKGLRSSLKKSINDKRFSRNIVDTINAEDIGRTTDQNIADALGRVTGVTVVSADGEGTQITVRGADANQNSITLNGQTLTSTDFSQAVDLSSFSADILSKLEVVKTPSADHDEGSLGASVNLVTVRPLDQAEPVRSFNVQGRYNDFSEEENHKLQFSISEKFFDETLGVALTMFDETNAYRRDQYRSENFMESPIYNQALDQDGNVISGVRAIVPTTTSYELHRNTSDRQGLSLGIQYLPSDTTEVMFDVNYSRQDLVRTMDGVETRNVPQQNWVEGGVSLSGFRPADPATDPLDWYQIDTETYTMTRRLDRYGAGNIKRSDGGTENENLSATLNFQAELTDSLQMSALVGYSNSESMNKPNAFTVMQNWKQVPAFALYDAGADIEPVGFDCTSGRCRMVTGESYVDLGDQLLDYVDENGVPVNGAEDNIAFTGYNPRDINSFHLGYISENDRRIEDTISNAQIDFDYDLDRFNVTSLEFGAKVTQRNKFVDDQSYRFTSLAKTEVVTDRFGNPVAIPNGPLSDIRGDLIQGEAIPYDNFMSTLGYGSDFATSGWTPIDVFAAKDLILDDDLTVRDVDNTETRETDIDTQALYFKANFEFMDGQLTGDIGVRYVKTDVEASGFSGIQFYEDPNGSDLEREFDRVTLRDLRDTSLPECAPLNLSADNNGYNYKFQRVDGRGWDTSAGPDPSTWVRIPDQGPCHDPSYAAWASAYGEFLAGNLDQEPARVDDFGITWYNMWRYADVSTSRLYGWDSAVLWDGVNSDSLNAASYDFETRTNRSLASTRASNSHSYTNLLPSLNLNYLFSEEIVARFSASQTMTRPEIDLLRPGYKVFEQGYWGSGLPASGRVDMFNTKLDPLESNNLDLSLEWYFNDTGLLSVAVFNKDMSNFTDRETNQTYLVDLRETAPENPDDLIMLPEDDGTDDWGLSGCMPIRTTADFGWASGDPTIISNDLRDLCGEYAVTKTVNATNARITGIEIGYQQNYDFLPGLLGGLGVSANYTYQDSEYDSEPSSLNPNLILPSYPVADTPEHSYNFTAFWEQNGHQIRLSFRGSSDSLVGRDYNTNQYGRSWNEGSIWNEGRDTVDLSAAWQVTDNVLVTFQAINLTDAAYRTYFTSRTLDVVRVAADNAAGYDFVALEEGNPLDGDAPKSRTYTNYKVGTTYRLGIRVDF
ncbi:TonB-dependent receptor [Alteromonas sp. KUL49]|uniref:TonB-dependent receptor n=1 Tax=Alteromonas sp. KUL49 TaxID=2480798 RepID=UPI00102EEC89|nr:TonB-dependent receptor [Alteromonas sp. KUL49]TAP40122.1 TonB-dependent receptor [Alteromonas sp. KUL49]GEA11235.1 hypothetical protein KUL49_16100 [Alteromonas sp. KUL49]